jgi:CspA family cold shock protein
MAAVGRLLASIKEVFSTMDERETGVVKWFNNQKGYGFIARESGEDVFVHHSAITEEGFRTLSEGDRVEFSVQDGEIALNSAFRTATRVRPLLTCRNCSCARLLRGDTIRRGPI